MITAQTIYKWAFVSIRIASSSECWHRAESRWHFVHMCAAAITKLCLVVHTLILPSFRPSAAISHATVLPVRVTPGPAQQREGGEGDRMKQAHSFWAHSCYSRKGDWIISTDLAFSWEHNSSPQELGYNIYSFKNGGFFCFNPFFSSFFYLFHTHFG